MQIQQAYQLQAKFKAGLTLVGEDFEGNLEWIGDTKQWKRAEQIEADMIFEPDYRDFTSGYDAVTPDKL